MSFLFVPGSEESNSELTLPQAERLASSATWRGKHMQPQFWRRAWRKASWFRRLSGATLEPSTLDRGVESWIASLRESRVSRIAPPANNADTTTNAPCGPSSSASLTNVDPPWSSSKTSQLSLDGFENPEKLYADWVTRCRTLSSSLRKTLAHRIDANGCSSWHTPRANDSEKRGDVANEKRSGLYAQVQWQTPSVADTDGGRMARSGDRSDEMLLKGQANKWPTPNAHDGMWPGSDETSTQGANLKRDAESWPTPKTPTGGPEARIGRAARGSGGEDLEARALMFPTPRFGPHGTPGAGLRHPAIETAGPKSSPNARTLNPLFVEWLMGFPIGWTDCEPLETASFLSWRRLHSVNCFDESRRDYAE